MSRTSILCRIYLLLMIIICLSISPICSVNLYKQKLARQIKYCEYGNNNTTANCTDANIDHIPYIKKELVVLILSLNNFNAIPEINQFKNLKNLDLSGNQNITSLEYPGTHTSLKVLIASNCSIASLENGVFKAFPRLELLNLSSNKITNVDYNLRSKTLRDLHLNDNYIKFLNDTTFINLSSLRTLSLHNNENLKTVQFPSSPTLRKLNLSNCTLTNASIGDLFDLEILVIKRNSFPIISEDTFEYFRMLQLLDISYNGITSVSHTSFDNLNELHTLLLTHNQLSYLSPETFKIIPLANLNISYNLFYNLNNLYSKSLKQLDASHNRISTLNDNVLYVQLPFLSALFLRGNNIASFNDSLHSQYLKLLDLSDNKIKNLTGISMESIPNLKQLELKDNPWECKCESLREFYRRLRANNINDKEFIWTCQNNEFEPPKTWFYACSTSLEYAIYTFDQFRDEYKAVNYFIYLVMALSVIHIAYKRLKKHKIKEPPLLATPTRLSQPNPYSSPLHPCGAINRPAVDPQGYSEIRELSSSSFNNESVEMTHISRRSSSGRNVTVHQADIPSDEESQSQLFPETHVYEPLTTSQERFSLKNADQTELPSGSQQTTPSEHVCGSHDNLLNSHKATNLSQRRHTYANLPPPNSVDVRSDNDDEVFENPPELPPRNNSPDLGRYYENLTNFNRSIDLILNQRKSKSNSKQPSCSRNADDPEYHIYSSPFKNPQSSSKTVYNPQVSERPPALPPPNPPQNISRSHESFTNEKLASCLKLVRKRSKSHPSRRVSSTSADRSKSGGKPKTTKKKKHKKNCQYANKPERSQSDSDVSESSTGSNVNRHRSDYYIYMINRRRASERMEMEEESNTSKYCKCFDVLNF